METLVRHRRGHEPTKAPLKVTTLLPVINVNQQDTKGLPNNLNAFKFKIEPSNPTKGVTIGPFIKKIGTTVTTPVLMLYTTRKPVSTKPMVIFKNNNDMVTIAPKAEIEAIKKNDTNSGQTNNEIHSDVTKIAEQPNADSKNTLQTICLEEHTRKQLDDVHENHIGKSGKEKKEETKHTTYHVSDKNGKKITEITTTKIIEENSDNTTSKQQSNETCDTLDLTNVHSLIKHLTEEKVKDKTVIKSNASLNGTNVNKNLGSKRNILESLTINGVDELCHKINSDPRNLNTHISGENIHAMKQEDKSHEDYCDTKKQATHLFEVKSEYSRPLDKIITDEVKECNLTQQLEKKNKATLQPQNYHVDLKDKHPNITIKVLVDTPKVDVIKLANVSSIDLKTSVENITTKTSDCNINSVKIVPKLPMIKKVNTLLISRPQVTILPKRTIIEIVNTTDSNTTTASNNKKPKDLDIQRMKMSIKVEINSANKSIPVDCKNMTITTYENDINDTYTNVYSKQDNTKSGKCNS